MSARARVVTVGETMALKLANALLVRPKLLLLGQLYDLLPPHRLRAALRLLKDHGTTVLLCTGRPEDMELDGYLYLGLTEQRRFDRLADLETAYSREDAHVA